MTGKGDFSRQSFLGAESEERLARLRVVIAGLGGGGSHVAQQLAHVGVGEIRLLDPDCIEPSNLNRLVGGMQDDVNARRPKVEIAQRTILGIRPWIRIVAKKKKWQEAAKLIADAHVVVGCLDGYQQRDYLEGAARRYLLPYIDVGMDVTKIADDEFAVSGQMIMTRPGGPCLQCLGFITPERLAQEENRYGDAGGNPQVVWTNGTLASLAVGALIKLVTPWFSTQDLFTWLELDGNAQTVMPSEQPRYRVLPKTCPHRGGQDGLGDPFFRNGLV
ncbi:MAG: ThiF family adenylyltransferase [Proteobacteria bacterium]|nr:ThiF family adenylyltransferase [Pseudomonadota bacterium]